MCRFEPCPLLHLPFTETENMTTATETEIRVGAVFGYRKVVEVTTRNVTYINLNGRKNASGKRNQRTPVTVTRAEFRKLAGLDD